MTTEEIRDLKIGDLVKINASSYVALDKNDGEDFKTGYYSQPGDLYVVITLNINAYQDIRLYSQNEMQYSTWPLGAIEVWFEKV